MAMPDDAKPPAFTRAMMDLAEHLWELTRKLRVGISADGFTQILDGVSDGEEVVARAGAFLRDGDFVRPVPVVEAK
jgi:hypothetical protein